MAGDKIKGIVIEIGADTQPLNKALEGVNKKSRDLQSELKQVDRLLKLDPTNTTLLEQKQKLLADAVGNTKDKLETLKEAEKQAQQQFKDGKIGEEQYRALQREVISTEKNLESLITQQNKANGILSETEIAAQQAAEALEKKAKADAEAALKAEELSNKSDKAIENLKKMRTAAIAAGAAVGAAFVGMANAALENADEFQRQSDVTGLSAERLQELAYAGNNLGVELDTITGAQAKLTKNMYAAMDGTGAQAEAFAALGVSVVDSNGKLRDAETVMNEAFTALNGVGNETERDALAMTLFGKSAMEMNPLIKAGGDELARLSEEARNNGAVMSNEAVAGLDTFGDTVDNLKTSILGAFGEKFAEMLPNIQEFIDKLQELPQWIDENSSLITILGAVIGTITALIIAFNIQQSLLASGMTLWSTAAGVATTITTGLGAAFAFLTSPIGLVIVAIGAVVAAGVLLYQNWDVVQAKANDLWIVVTDKFDKIKNGITDKINGAKDAVGKAIEKIKGFFDFEWELPKIKLPHFNISGKFSLNPPSVPKFDINWYKTGAIFNGPSVIGVGEAGPEAVLPIEKIDSIVASALNKAGNKGQTINLNIGTLVADDYGLKQLERKLKSVRIDENARLGVSG